MFAALGKYQAMLMPYIVICDLTYFFPTLSHKTHDFQKRKCYWK